MICNMIEYIIIAALLLVTELIYFKIADKCNIIDKPNERSSHSTIVLRGGGIIFSLSMIVWAILELVQGGARSSSGSRVFAFLVWTGTDMWHQLLG